MLVRKIRKKVNTVKKKILKIVGIILLLFVITLIAAPFFLKGKIADIIKNKPAVITSINLADSDKILSWIFDSLNNKNTKVICAGNSSSGIKETAIFKCPAVNIGPRQNGRFRSSNVFDVKYDDKQIYETIFKCIND